VRYIDIFGYSSLNNIAWILNLRGGGDIQYNPVFAAYLLVGKCSLKLFVDKKKVSDEVRSVIEEDLGGSIMEYDDIWSSFGGYKIVCDSNISWAVVESVGQVRHFS
jgi:Xaa-Pro aminopeptidase